MKRLVASGEFLRPATRNSVFPLLPGHAIPVRSVGDAEEWRGDFKTDGARGHPHRLALQAGAMRPAPNGVTLGAGPTRSYGGLAAACLERIPNRATSVIALGSPLGELSTMPMPKSRQP